MNKKLLFITLLFAVCTTPLAAMHTIESIENIKPQKKIFRLMSALN